MAISFDTIRLPLASRKCIFDGAVFAQEADAIDVPKVEELLQSGAVSVMHLDGSMPAQFASASSDAKTRLTTFMQDAEPTLAALYCSVRRLYGEQAAHGAAEKWLRIFEERLGESGAPPDIKQITRAAIPIFVSTIVKLSAGRSLDSAEYEASSKSSAMSSKRDEG